MKFSDCPSAAKKVLISATAVAGSNKECLLSPSSVHFSKEPEFKIPSVFSSDWVTWHVGTDFEINSFCNVDDCTHVKSKICTLLVYEPLILVWRRVF